MDVIYFTLQFESLTSSCTESSIDHLRMDWQNLRRAILYAIESTWSCGVPIWCRSTTESSGWSWLCQLYLA